MRSTCKFTVALAGLLPAVLLMFLAFPVETSAATPERIAAYDASHEVTFSGSVQEVITKRVPGSPVGMHLIVTGATGTIDTHVGPFLSKDVREALHTGLPIQIVGAMETLHGTQYLLARQLSYGGRTITLRNRNGFLLGPQSRNPNSLRTQKAPARVNGGAQ